MTKFKKSPIVLLTFLLFFAFFFGLATGWTVSETINIKNSEFKLIYKIDNGSYEDIFETKIVDPYLVVAECIKNAISIAGLLLTTKYMIINDGYIKIDNSIQTI